MSFGARAVISLGALRHNLQIIRDHAPASRVMAVIKANAYGHGLVPVAEALSEADSFAVARLEEALQLRNAGIEVPIVILQGVFAAKDCRQADRAGCEIVVHTTEQLDMLEQAHGLDLTVWLKFDTGMNRLGFGLQDADAIIDRARGCRAVRRLRLMSHLANADDRADETTATQLQLFRSLVDGFEGDVSIANSPGILGWPVGEFEPRGHVWIRPGISLYGISPFAAGTGAELGLRPVMQLESNLIAVKAVMAGQRVGYGGTWQASSDGAIGIVAGGYGDGYSRFLPSGTPVLVNGRRVSLAGRVSMDMIAVDLGSDTADKVGDPALLWGNELPVEELAGYAGTIAYALVCGVSNRVPREYAD